MLVLIQAHKGTSFFSRLIKWFSRSSYSHISTRFVEENTVIEAMEGKGVIERPAHLFNDAILQGKIDVFSFQINTEQKDKMLELMRRTLGEKYDWGHIFKFITRRRGSHNSRWFCSEHFLYHAQAVEVEILNTDPWLADPGDIVKSPNIRPVHHTEFI
jgi:hypothetical protein